MPNFRRAIYQLELVPRIRAAGSQGIVMPLQHGFPPVPTMAAVDVADPTGGKRSRMGDSAEVRA